MSFHNCFIEAEKHALSEGDNGNAETSFLAGWRACLNHLAAPGSPQELDYKELYENKQIQLLRFLGRRRAEMKEVRNKMVEVRIGLDNAIWCAENLQASNPEWTSRHHQALLARDVATELVYGVELKEKK